MKNALMAFAGLVLLVVIGWGLAKYQKPNPSSAKPVSQPAGSIANESVTLTPHSVLSSIEWKQYRDARQKALTNNPELATEYKELLIEVDSQQGDLNLAMIKIDPNVEAAISKLDLIRKKNSVWH